MKDLFLALNILTRLFVAFIGFIFLLGQAFFGDFTWFSTAAGIGGFAVAGLTGWPIRFGPLLTKIGLVGGAMVLIGVSVHVYDHYANHNIPGSYYAWFITLPYIAGVTFLMAAAMRGQTLR